jgi:adenine specific DNA methylase Mod
MCKNLLFIKVKGVIIEKHLYSVVLPRMKKVLAYDKSGISKEIKDYQGRGFFKYYELEQYEETLSNSTGKWIKKISDDEVEFEDETKIDTKVLDYKLIKPLIWWE